MDEQTIQINDDTLARLLPLCVQFCKEYKETKTVDLQAAADKVGSVFGIEDVNAFAQAKLENGLIEGFKFAMSEEDAKELTAVFADTFEPAASAIHSFAKGGCASGELLNTLNELAANSTDSIQAILQNSLGIPDELADLLSEKLGPYTVSVYCLAATYKIYRKCAQDAALAKEKRIEIERRCNGAIAQIKAERAEMEKLFNTYMLDNLPAFSDSVSAIDQAILDNDDDGFIAANADLWELFGRKCQYRTAQEFDDFMLSDEAFVL